MKKMVQELNGSNKFVIIDPVSPEFNRGSFCYLPYILASTIEDSVLIENFNAADIDSLPSAEQYLIALWSHPQIEQVTTLLRFLPRGKAKVFGYAPLIRELGLPLYLPTGEEIIDGLGKYVRKQEEFSHILLSDCDMHLKEYAGQVWPMFTSYGCPNGCTFCPSTANQPQRLVVDIDTVKENLNWMAEKGHTSIHFTDEDFFFDTDRAAEICLHLVGMKTSFQLIALAERHTLQKFIDNYGSTLLELAGFKLLEVGLESAEVGLAAKMGKAGPGGAEHLAQACSVPILWLTLTFFPGETIKSLRSTGLFLEKWGLRTEDLYSRIATNGTVGGLGQFFQPYEGTKGYLDLVKKGILLTDRPLRLLPSFIPYSFLKEHISKIRPVREDELKWYQMYHVDPPMRLGYEGTVEHFLNKDNSIIDECISLAISARIGVIE